MIRELVRLWRSRHWHPTLVCGDCIGQLMVEKTNATFDWFECPKCHYRAIKSDPWAWPGGVLS